ncbi:uncharacterized protein N0V89_008378 [Didymosphaeria variabile]|uniref:Uncharacterized protein n=1 Tax=Didymosphaeria variabile TaxID=1932322 RepID=A0A9W9C7R4_9PLEO|nr:uncharacterized protein N0V89_008378 [Didymosphaeria variabile]KAJ4349760.1 hypothetical protein N0V89_008378 [Didymosphaeria variabile]
MASIYLVNALYNKPSVPAAPIMQPTTEVKHEATESDQPAATVEETVTMTGITEPATEAYHRETQLQEHIEAVQRAAVLQAQTGQRSENGDVMHPSRQQMVSFLGPLEERPEPVAYKVSGANTQPLGQIAPPAPCKRGKNAVKKQKPTASEPPASESIQAARERSFHAVAPSATAAARLGQHLHTVGGTRVIAGRDPRRRTQAGEGQEASSSPASANATHFRGIPIKQEGAAWEPFPEQPRPKLPASPPQRAESAPYHAMVGREYLNMPAGSVGVFQDVLAARPKHSDSDPPSEAEARIKELEDENLSLRKEGFCKDREIRKLRAELLSRGICTSTTKDAAFGAGVKRARHEEDVGGPVREP